MDTRRLFQALSEKIRAEFQTSAEIKHAGSKGTARENHLREFLSQERLPARYGLGTGEVVSRIWSKTSGQCDIIIYDRLNGVALIYDKGTQVLPVDCVCGIIEVKSALSKAEFLDALEKIKTLKAMAPTEPIRRQQSPGPIMAHPRPKPFGAVFAYGLADNSLGSLLQNLEEWEKENGPENGPNYVCVLGEGVILHHGRPFEEGIHSDQLTSKSWPIALYHREDSLFHFYCAVHDMCTHMQLVPVELRRYYTQSIQVGKYIVDGMENWKREKDGRERVIALTEVALDRIVSWCAERGSASYGETLVKRFGALPLGMEDSAILKAKTFLFNPDNLPGLHEMELKGGLVETFRKPTLASAVELRIDRHLYVIPWASLADEDFEELK